MGKINKNIALSFYKKNNKNIYYYYKRIMSKRPNPDTNLENKKIKTEGPEFSDESNQFSEEENELSEEDQFYYDIYSLLFGYEYNEDEGTFSESNDKLKKGYEFWNDMIIIISENWDYYNSQWNLIKTRNNTLPPTLLQFLQNVKPQIAGISGDTITKIPYNVFKIIHLFPNVEPKMLKLEGSIVTWFNFFNTSQNPNDLNYSELSQQDGGKKRKTKKTNKKRKWSKKYKKSINCKRPKGFSQKQYCKYGRKK